MATIRQRILAVIQESPGIHADEVRARLPELTLSQIVHAVEEMKAAGRLESCGYGRYRVPEPRRPSKAGAGQTADMRKLMAGR